MNEDKGHMGYYENQYAKYGYSPKSLGWEKGKQEIRFEILTSNYDFTNKSILDIGCGFGDLNQTLSRYNNYYYYGVDMINEFICEANKRYKSERVSFKQGDFLTMEFNDVFDYAIASGIFNYKLEEDNYYVAETVIEKTMNLVNDGLAFDYLSNKVDYQLEHTFHYDPSKMLSIAYKYSRNVILRNDYMPFEFTLFIFNDDSFETYDTLFNRYKKRRKNEKNINFWK